MRFQKINKYLLVIVSAFLCFQSISFADSVIPVSIDNTNYRPLGAGFDSRKQEFRADCVEGSEPRQMQLSSGTIDLKLEASQDSLADKLGMSAGGRYRSGVTTTTASAEFLNQSQSNGYSISYNYVAENLFREYLENSTEHPIQNRPGIADYTKDQRVFFANCGDEYVYGRDRAARLYVNMKISFVTKQERNRFAASFGIDSPTFSMQANLEKESSKYSSNNQIQISALQVGGNPEKMGKILCPKKLDGSIDEECAKSSRMVVNCSFGDLKPCMDVIANVIAYANAQDGGNFPSQIANGNNFSVTKLYTRPFVYIGSQYPPVPQKTTEDNFQAQVKQFNDLFEQEYSNWLYSNQLWKGKAPRLSPRQKTAMELLQDVFYRNVQRLAQGIENCFNNGYTACTNDLEQAKIYISYGKTDRKSIKDIEDLTTPEAFVQFCDLATDDNPDIAITVKSLRQYLVNQNLIDKEELNRGDACFKMDQKLSGLKDLDLSGVDTPIADLRPVATLSHLQSLNLSNRGISDISKLGSLSNLVTLFLDNNLIKDVSPLTQLSNLQFVSVKNNRISDLSSLGKLPSLNQIEARGNSKGLKCPLAASNQCKLLDFSDSINISLNTNSCDLRVGHAAANFDDNSILVTGGSASNGLAVAKNTMEIRSRDSCTLSLKRMLIPRTGHTMTRLTDGRYVVIGGLSDTIEILNPDLSSHIVNSKMNSIRSKHTATLLNDGRILIVGGYTDHYNGAVRSSNVSSTIEIFDPKNESLKVVDHSLVPRAEHTATLLKNGTVLIVGGYASERMVSIAEVFDPASNHLHEIDETLVNGRMGHAATLLTDGRVIIIGGYHWIQTSNSGNVQTLLQALDSIEIYDPQAETFNQIEDKLGTPRGSLSAFTMYDDRVLMIGGEISGKIFLGFDFPLPPSSSLIEVFDPATLGVYQIGNMNLKRTFFAAMPVGKKSILISGGTGDEKSPVSSELVIYRSTK